MIERFFNLQKKLFRPLIARGNKINKETKMALRVGQTAPDFVLESHLDRPIHLSDISVEKISSWPSFHWHGHRYERSDPIV
jgi:hypothetical protein